MLDISGSIQPSDWAMEKNFVKDLAKQLKISPTGGHAAVILFSDNARLHIKFSDHSDTASFNTAVDLLPYTAGGTRMDKGLEVALNQMFNAANGMRPNSSKSVLLMTDGSNNVPMDTTSIKNKFKARNIKLIVVGAGAVDKVELEKLVDSPKDLHLASSMRNLKAGTLFKDVKKGLCKGTKSNNFRRRKIITLM